MMLNAHDIAKLGEISTLLEVSGYPKPGNVHRTQDFKEITYEDFIVSGVSIRDSLEIAAYNGSKCYPNMLDHISVGECILRAIRDTQQFVNSNTNLGISMLLVPLAATFGALTHEDSITNLPSILTTMIKNSQVDDAVALVKAISLANAGGMENKTSKYDVNNSNTLDDIRDNNINMYGLLEMSAKYDKISQELISGLPVIRKYGYPTYAKYMRDYSTNDVTVAVFLEILANVPDTLISRKYDEDVAMQVSENAKMILEDTSIASSDRLEAIEAFDQILRKNNYNPGTTADFTAASIYVGLVDKYSVNGL
ncbi:MAG: triphosphoribosyl-dephospho-CoA synthase [Methanosphaera sp.]|nr:triphosphoribosyl-dephospho-CoA synthase [Methanosphaera sp.]